MPNISLSDGIDSILIGANDQEPNQFLDWLNHRLGDGEFVTPFVVNGVMCHYDGLRTHEGLITRVSLVNWLWERRGHRIKCEIKNKEEAG